MQPFAIYAILLFYIAYMKQFMLSALEDTLVKLDAIVTHIKPIGDALMTLAYALLRQAFIKPCEAFPTIVAYFEKTPCDLF